MNSDWQSRDNCDGLCCVAHCTAVVKELLVACLMRLLLFSSASTEVQADQQVCQLAHQAQQLCREEHSKGDNSTSGHHEDDVLASLEQPIGQPKSSTASCSVHTNAQWWAERKKRKPMGTRFS